MSDFIFYTHPLSRGRNVRWMLEECDAQYETRYLTFNGTMKSDDYLKINPMGKVPALVHKNKVITETAAIIVYLADIFPDMKLTPENRADYYRWIFFINGALEGALIAKLLKADSSPKAQSISGYGSLELVVKTLEDWLKNRDFIAADHFTAADIIAVSVINFGKKQSLLASPVLDSYSKAICSRPAFIRATNIDNAKTKEMAC